MVPARSIAAETVPKLSLPAPKGASGANSSQDARLRKLLERLDLLAKTIVADRLIDDSKPPPSASRPAHRSIRFALAQGRAATRSLGIRQCSSCEPQTHVHANSETTELLNMSKSARPEASSDQAGA